MSEKLTHMNCGGVGRLVPSHEIDHWKTKGYAVTEDAAAQPKPAPKAPKQPKPAPKAEGSTTIAREDAKPDSEADAEGPQ